MTKEMAWPFARKLIAKARASASEDEHKKIVEIVEETFPLIKDHIDHIFTQSLKWDRNRKKFWKRTNSAPWYISESKDHDRVSKKQILLLSKLK